MEILGIGPSELVFIIIIALIVLGPKDMQKAGRTIGRWLNDLVRSDGWKALQRTSQELQNLPTTLMREANMEMAETERELRKATDLGSLQLPSSRGPSVEAKQDAPPQPKEPENTIQPPTTQPVSDPPPLDSSETTSPDIEVK